MRVGVGCGTPVPIFLLSIVGTVGVRRGVSTLLSIIIVDIAVKTAKVTPSLCFSTIFFTTINDNNNINPISSSFSTHKILSISIVIVAVGCGVGAIVPSLSTP